MHMTAAPRLRAAAALSVGAVGVAASSAFQVGLDPAAAEVSEGYRTIGRTQPGPCPGEATWDGFGTVSLVPTGWEETNASKPFKTADIIDGDVLVPHLDARLYFASECSGYYDRDAYMGVNMLNQRVNFTVDLAGAGCGCNAAFYLVSMKQNDHLSKCSDYYCDANDVCGESCDEIDLMEANTQAFHSTLHTSGDKDGTGGGFGGGDGWTGPRNFTSAQYGPGGQCINTLFPFNVSVAFPTDREGNMVAMEVSLSQSRGDCPLEIYIAAYPGMERLSRSLKAGMTPVVSYWGDDNMLWMDGVGKDRRGPCEVDDESQCSETVRMWDFSLEPYVPWQDPQAGGGAAAPEDAVEQTAEGGVAEDGADFDDVAFMAPPAPPVAAATTSTSTSTSLSTTSAAASTTATTGAWASAALRHPLRCASSGTEDCRPYGCCEELGHHCFEKNAYWSACLPDCGTHTEDGMWTCLNLETGGEEAASTTTTTTTREQLLRVLPGESGSGEACAAPHDENCLHSRCCQDSDTKCYRKNEHWASCNETCSPGISQNDIAGFRTPWSCELLDRTAVDQLEAAAEALAEALHQQVNESFIEGFNGVSRITQQPTGIAVSTGSDLLAEGPQKHKLFKPRADIAPNSVFFLSALTSLVCVLALLRSVFGRCGLVRDLQVQQHRYQASRPRQVRKPDGASAAAPRDAEGDCETPLVAESP